MIYDVIYENIFMTPLLLSLALWVILTQRQRAKREIQKKKMDVG